MKGKEKLEATAKRSWESLVVPEQPQLWTQDAIPLKQKASFILPLH